MNRSFFGLHCHLKMSLMVQTHLILHEDLLELRLFQKFLPPVSWRILHVDPVLKWIFSELDLIQKVYSSICDWKHELLTPVRRYHFFRIESRMGFWRAQVYELFKVCHFCVSFPDSTRVQNISEEYSEEHFLSKLMDSWLVFSTNWVIFNHWTKRNYQSFEWFTKSPFIKCFPVR